MATTAPPIPSALPPSGISLLAGRRGRMLRENLTAYFRNALTWPLLVTNSPEWRPIAVGLTSFLDEAGAQIHWQMAGAVITMPPILALYFVAQRQFTDSFAHSGIRG